MNRWVVGSLVGLSIVLTWFMSNVIGMDNNPGSLFSTPCSTSVAIFEQKKRCGFQDLGRLIVVTGNVKNAKIYDDGDVTLDLILDHESEWALYHPDNPNRKTDDYLHVEFMPCERVYPDVENVLTSVMEAVAKGESPKVVIMGRWAFDGVDHRGKWEQQLMSCLEGRDPELEIGWTEIHPAYSIEFY